MDSINLDVTKEQLEKIMDVIQENDDRDHIGGKTFASIFFGVILFAIAML